MSYSPLAIANAFIARHGGERGITHMQLQKLVYLVHGWWLSVHNDPIVNENPEVWQFGPVFPTLYRRLRDHRAEPIKEPKDAAPGLVPEPVPEGDALKVIDWVWEKYGHMTGPQLSNRTHEVGSPWHQVAAKHKFRVPFGTDIPKDTVQEYYRREAQTLAGRRARRPTRRRRRRKGARLPLDGFAQIS